MTQVEEGKRENTFSSRVSMLMKYNYSLFIKSGVQIYFQSQANVSRIKKKV